MTDEPICIDSLGPLTEGQQLYLGARGGGKSAVNATLQETWVRHLFYEVRAESFAHDVHMAANPWLDPKQGNRQERRRLRKAYRKVRNAAADEKLQD